MHHAKPAQDGKQVTLGERLRVGGRARQKGDDRPGRRVRDDVAQADTQALRVRRVKEDVGARGRGDLVHAADVVGMTVGAHDPGDLVHPSPDAAEVGAHDAAGPAVSRVDERELVLDDEECLGPAEAERMDVRKHLHR